MRDRTGGNDSVEEEEQEEHEAEEDDYEENVDLAEVKPRIKIPQPLRPSSSRQQEVLEAEWGLHRSRAPTATQETDRERLEDSPDTDEERDVADYEVCNDVALEFCKLNVSRLAAFGC